MFTQETAGGVRLSKYYLLNDFGGGSITVHVITILPLGAHSSYSPSDNLYLGCRLRSSRSTKNKLLQLSGLSLYSYSIVIYCNYCIFFSVSKICSKFSFSDRNRFCRPVSVCMCTTGMGVMGGIELPT